MGLTDTWVCAQCQQKQDSKNIRWNCCPNHEGPVCTLCYQVLHPDEDKGSYIREALKTINGGVTLAYNQCVVVCPNEDCEYFDKERVVSMPPVSHDVYLGGNLFCKCGYAVYRKV